MSKKRDPIQPTDDAARALARDLVRGAATAALGVIHPDTGAPHVTRVAFGLSARGEMLTLVSALSLHTRAMRSDPRVSLLLGEVGAKGDPLTHPRISIAARAAFVPADDPDRARLRADWLGHHPKAQLYIDFADFAFVRFDPDGASLNGGFARAYQLLREDLTLT